MELFASQLVLRIGAWDQPDLHPLGALRFEIIDDPDANRGQRFTGWEMELTDVGFAGPLFGVDSEILVEYQRISEREFEREPERLIGRAGATCAQASVAKPFFAVDSSQEFDRDGSVAKVVVGDQDRCDVGGDPGADARGIP